MTHETAREEDVERVARAIAEAEGFIGYRAPDCHFNRIARAALAAMGPIMRRERVAGVRVVADWHVEQAVLLNAPEDTGGLFTEEVKYHRQRSRDLNALVDSIERGEETESAGRTGTHSATSPESPMQGVMRPADTDGGDANG